MFILETSACTDASVLATILFIKKLVKILSIIVPAILIVLLSIDFTKAVMANDDNGIKRAQKLAIKRLIYGVIVFFVPIIVDVSFGLLDSKDTSKSCFSNATQEVVDALVQADKEKLIEKENEKKELIEVIKKNHLTAQEAVEKLRKNPITNNGGDTSNVNVPKKYVQAKKIAEAAGGGKNCSDRKGHNNCPLGDQTGKEVRFSKWRKGWTYIFRHDDPEKANKAALCMERAVNNSKIGYGINGSSPWKGLWNYLSSHKELGFDPGKVNKKTSVSCCPLVAVCLKYAGYKPSAGLGCTNPSNMQKALNKAGKFTKISSRNLTQIRRGDILISSHHMAMAV